MEPKIITLSEKNLVGMRIETSISNFGSPQLWQTFMPRRKEIENRIEGAYYSIQVYPAGFQMKDFTPTTLFDYWAAIEVESEPSPPSRMESFKLPGGAYAVFIHRGPMSTFQQTLGYIHGQWLPNSEFELDERPHFELLGDHYLGPNNPDSEEEVWVPIKSRA